MAKKTYFVKEPVRHDGDDFPVGAEIKLEPAQASVLLSYGVIDVDAPVAEEQNPDLLPASETEAQ